MSQSPEAIFDTPGHTFAVGAAVRFSAGAPVKAQANLLASTATGMVTSVTDSDHVQVLSTGGTFVTLPAHGLGSVGAKLYVSQATAGILTTTKPLLGLVQEVGEVLSGDLLHIYYKPVVTL